MTISSFDAKPAAESKAKKAKVKKSKPKAPPKQARVLTQPELQLLWSELSYPHDEIAKLAYYTCSRGSEIISLEWSNLRSEKRISIWQQKVGESKSIRANERIQGCLDRIAANYGIEGYLFPSNSQSGHISRIAFHKALKDAAELCELEGTQNHSFRRSMCTHLYDSGMKLLSICKFSGHKTESNLLKYIDVAWEDAQDGMKRMLSANFAS